MSNMNEIFMGGNKETIQSGSSDSGSSYVSSSSDDHNRNKSKKKASKSRTRIDTPLGQIELEPDAFRGAMNPDIVQSNANRDNNSNQPLGEQVVDDGGITPGTRYNPDDISSRDATENLNRKKSSRKHRKSHHSRRNSRKDRERTFWHCMYKGFWLRNQERNSRIKVPKV